MGVLVNHTRYQQNNANTNRKWWIYVDNAIFKLTSTTE